MISESLPIDAVNWHEQAVQCMSKGNYAQAVRLYEQAIVAEPHIYSHYWHLGLMLLLQEQEAEAQTTWLLAMAEGDEEQVEQWTAELIEVLQTEAERRKSLEDYSVAWAIRQHIREISPTDINNLLHLIELYIQIKTYTGKELTELGVIDLLQPATSRTRFSSISRHSGKGVKLCAFASLIIGIDRNLFVLYT